MKKLPALLSLAACHLQALSLQPLVHIDLRGGYAGLAGQSSTPLFQGEVFAVPAVQLAENASLTPSLYMVGGGQQRSLEEAALFVETASMGFRPQFKYRVANGSAYIVRMEARRAYNVEAVNETPGTGRYDYEDYRLGSGWDSAPSDLPYGASLELNHRTYPNYHNIVAAVALTDNKNFYLKDYQGAKAEAHFGEASSGRLTLSVEQKSYGDAYLINTVNGQVDTTQTQADRVVEAAMQGSVSMAERLDVRWNVGWQGNFSNQNSFDTAQAVSLPNSNDYIAAVLSLNAQWKTADSGLALNGGYTVNFRNLNRPIQNLSGTYADGKVAEVEHDLNLGLSAPVGYGVRAVAGGEARFLLSNQQFAAAGIPSYTYFSSSVGLQWDWQGNH